MMMMSLPVLLDHHHHNPVMFQGEHSMVKSCNAALSKKEKESEKKGTYTLLAPLQTPTDVKIFLMQTAQHPFLIQDS